MTKKFKDLTATDFPGVDPVKFEEWKKERNSSVRNQIIGDLIVLAIMLMAQFGVFTFGALEWLLCVVAIFIINMVATMKFRKLGRELNITNSTVRDALRKPW
jgi:hypothetical protein